jgi:hypothetical protein
MSGGTEHPENPKHFLPTRGTLLSRLKDLDDSDSWRRFFDTYWKLIYGVAIKAGLSSSDAQEVVQREIDEKIAEVATFHLEPAELINDQVTCHPGQFNELGERGKNPRVGGVGGQRFGRTFVPAGFSFEPQPRALAPAISFGAAPRIRSAGLRCRLGDRRKILRMGYGDPVPNGPKQVPNGYGKSA